MTASRLTTKLKGLGGKLPLGGSAKMASTQHSYCHTHMALMITIQVTRTTYIRMSSPNTATTWRSYIIKEYGFFLFLPHNEHIHYKLFLLYSHIWCLIIFPSIESA